MIRLVSKMTVLFPVLLLVGVCGSNVPKEKNASEQVVVNKVEAPNF